jgi:diguanylate cyclase (GGDEF)-like protein
MVPQQRRFRLQLRAVSAGLCAVLAVLAGLTVLLATSADRSAQRLERSGDLVEAYLTLNEAVVEQDSIEDSYGDAPSLRTRRAFRAASRRIVFALDRLERYGDGDDALLATQIRAAEVRYAGGMEALFRAVAEGDADAAEEIDESRLDPWGQRLGVLATMKGPPLAAEALREIDALRRSQRTLLAVTLVGVPLALLAFAILGLALRSLRRRLDQAQADELQRLEQFALTDSLTGIGNHRAFDESLSRELARAQRSGGTIALVMLDLDGLKVTNDRRGHQAGDRMIKAVASALAGTARAGDSVFRIGGDEYAAVLPDTQAWGAFELAQRIHQALGDAASVSAGVADSGGASTAEELFAAADAALLTAKRAGRDTVIHVAGMDVGPEEHDGEDGRARRATLAAALARAVDAKDSWTRSHCETVAELAGLIAGGLGLDPAHVDDLRLAALVHDVGKIGIPDAILQKPAALSDEEYEIVKGHAALGHKIIAGTDLAGVAPWVLHHHERIDGAGYPDRLAGDAIPLEARIIHVADAFEAMTSDRPYRAGMPEGAALAELERNAGTQFDPACVAALAAAIAAPALGR